MSIQSIGFIGLGAMGLPMAKRLIEGGFTVKSTVHRNTLAGETFKAAGGVLVSSLPEVVQGVDLVLSIVSDDSALLEIYGNKDFFQAMPENVLVLEMSSCSPNAIKKIALDYQKKTVNFIDAPVSGGVAGAKGGTLIIFAAGPPEALDAVGSVAKVLGKMIRLDTVGDGKAVKAVNQMLAAVNTIAVSEAYVLAKKLGLNTDKIYEIIKESSGSSFVFNNRFMNMVRKDFSGGFKFHLMKKDLGIAVGEAKGLDLPLLALAEQIYSSYKGNGELDYSVLSTLYDSPK